MIFIHSQMKYILISYIIDLNLERFMTRTTKESANQIVSI